MSLRISVSGAALIAALWTAVPVRAEDAVDPQAGVKADTARLQAQAALVNAQTEVVKAKATALGLPSAAGTTTLGEGAGAMEAWMLSSAAINEAARTIADSAKGLGPILVLPASETVNLGLGASLRAEIAALNAAADNAQVAGCPRAPARADPRFMAAGAALPLLGAVVSALKVDTEVRALEVKADDRALVNAIAARLGAEAIIPTEAVNPGARAAGALISELDGLGHRRNAAFQCRSQWAASGDTADIKAKVAILDSLIARIDEFQLRVSQGGADAPSLLIRASQLAAIADRNPLVLRVAIERAGGSLLKRTNLWTAFGAEGVSLTGGLVVSYRLTDPRSGSIRAAGLLICRTAKTRMGDVQRGRVGVAGCTATTAQPT